MTSKIYSGLIFTMTVCLLFSCSMPDATPSFRQSDGASVPVQATGSPPFTTHPWQLVKIMSMDDRTFSPQNSSRFTLRFAEKGRLEVRADCNFGQGTWTYQEPSGLLLENFAMTRASCRPASLHDRFLSNLSYVRSFVLKEDNLFLATMADGAILEFESQAP